MYALNRKTREAYKELQQRMQLRKHNVIAMDLLTNEEVYKKAIKIIKEATRSFKKLLRPRLFNLNKSQTTVLIDKCRRLYLEFAVYIRRTAEAMLPNKSADVIDSWVGYNEKVRNAEKVVFKGFTLRTDV